MTCVLGITSFCQCIYSPGAMPDSVATPLSPPGKCFRITR